MANDKPLQKILYVDDEPDISEIVKLSLERLGGFDVAVCYNGKEALTKIAEIMPDMLLMDVMMPEMDGPTALREIRKDERYKHIPIVFVTAKVQPYEIEHFRQLGAADVIAKPFDPMELSKQIEEIWRKSN